MRRFNIPQIAEFYGATECNCSLGNFGNKVKAVARAVSGEVDCSSDGSSAPAGWSMRLQQPDPSLHLPHQTGEGR